MMKLLVLILPLLAFATAGIAVEPEVAKRLIKVTAKVIEGPAAAVPPGAIIAPAELKAKLAEIAGKKGWDILSAPTVITREGREAKIEIGRELPAAPGADPRVVGLSVGIVGHSAPDGAIRLDAHCVTTEEDKEKGELAPLLTFEQKLEILAPAGQTVALAFPTGNPDRFTTFLITPEWIDAAGKVIP